MRLLIGWIIRCVLIAAAASAVIAWAVSANYEHSGNGAPFLPTFWWAWAITSAAAIAYFIADYLIDYDDWQRGAGKR